MKKTPSSIDLAGQLDIYNSHDITLLVEAYRERGFYKFILNLKKVTYLDNSIISVFIHCYQMLKDEGRFVLAWAPWSAQGSF